MRDKRPTACFIGTRLEALQALKRYTRVLSIVTVDDSWVHRDCQKNNIVAHLLSKERKNQIFHFLAEQPARLVLSAGFPYILPERVLDSAAIFINSHPALLPAYKGCNAIQQAFGNREEYLGVSVHFMVEKMDAGELICREKVWVKGMALQEIYELLFGVVEPMAITKATEILFRDGTLEAE